MQFHIFAILPARPNLQFVVNIQRGIYATPFVIHWTLCGNSLEIKKSFKIYARCIPDPMQFPVQILWQQQKVFNIIVLSVEINMVYVIFRRNIYSVMPFVQFSVIHLTKICPVFRSRSAPPETTLQGIKFLHWLGATTISMQR